MFTLPPMHRILILDGSPLRALLVENLLRSGRAEVVVAEDEKDLVSRVKFGSNAAVFADSALLSNDGGPLVDAVRSASDRPMLVIASNTRVGDLDPDVVTLVVRKPWDVQTLTGILLSAITQLPGNGNGPHDTTSPR